MMNWNITFALRNIQPWGIISERCKHFNGPQFFSMTCLSLLIDDCCIIRPYIIAYSAFHKQGCIIINPMRVTQRLIITIVAPQHWVDSCLFLSSSFNMPSRSRSLLDELMIMFMFLSHCVAVLA